MLARGASRSRSFSPRRVVWRPTFQIGPDKYGYVYGETQNQVGGRPVYQCSHGRDSEPGCLYLVWLGWDWEAVQVAGPPPATGADVLNRMSPAFRATEYDDVRTEGRHLRQCWDGNAERRWPASPFLTKTCQ